MENFLNKIDLKVPDLGDTDRIEVIKWYVTEKQTVKMGEEILELETDKASFTMESPANGIIQSIYKSAGSIVKKAEVLGTMLKEV